MNGLFRAFLVLLATSTDRELARQVEYLRAENRILRGKLPQRIAITPAEKQRLIGLGKPLGAALKELISIVSPRTFTRWLTAGKPIARKPSKPGRPKTEVEIRDLVVRLARENGWGYTRILGELKKLGVRTIARSTVVNILKENDLDPGPKRGEGTWSDFVTRHAKTLWATDFFSKKVWTTGGLVEFFILFVIHVGSRRVFVSGMTAQPDQAWTMQQARNMALHFAEQPDKPTLLLRDHDGKFPPEFDQILESEGVEVKKVGPLAPNLNAYAERWVQTVKQECLDHFVVFGEAHLRYLLTEYVTWYHTCRPHQAKDNVPLTGAGPPPVSAFKGEDIACDERLGGLLKHYHRRAA
ncbi:MAG: integrase core domain-containing protein [Gemmataceae bacterium]|nr:integrase core domain-containing protein [Gemmataceae bacterium]